MTREHTPTPTDDEVEVALRSALAQRSTTSTHAPLDDVWTDIISGEAGARAATPTPIASRPRAHRWVLPAVAAGVAAALVVALVLADPGGEGKAPVRSGGTATLVRYELTTTPTGYRRLDDQPTGSGPGYCLRFHPAGMGIECEAVAGMSSVTYLKDADSSTGSTGNVATTTVPGTVPAPGVDATAPADPGGADGSRPGEKPTPDVAGSRDVQVTTVQYPDQDLEAYRKELAKAVTGTTETFCAQGTEVGPDGNPVAGATTAVNGCPPEATTTETSTDGRITDRTIGSRPALAWTTGSGQARVWLPQDDVVVTAFSSDPDLSMDDFDALVASLRPVEQPAPRLLPIWNKGIAPVGVYRDEPAAAYDIGRRCVLPARATTCATFSGSGAVRVATDVSKGLSYLVLAETAPAVATVRIEFADGPPANVVPTHFAGFGEEGYVAVLGDRDMTSITGLDADGKIVKEVPPSSSSTSSTTAAAPGRGKGTRIRYELPAAPAGFSPTTSESGPVDLCLAYHLDSGSGVGIVCDVAAGQASTSYQKDARATVGATAGSSPRIVLETLQYPDQDLAEYRKRLEQSVGGTTGNAAVSSVTIAGRPALAVSNRAGQARYWLATDDTFVIAATTDTTMTAAEFDGLLATAKPVASTETPQYLPIWNRGKANLGFYEDPDAMYSIRQHCAVTLGAPMQCVTFGTSDTVRTPPTVLDGWSRSLVLVRTDPLVAKVRMELSDGTSLEAVVTHFEGFGGEGYVTVRDSDLKVRKVVTLDADGKVLGEPRP